MEIKRVIWWCLLLAFQSEILLAQAVLPKHVGIVGYTYRGYRLLTHEYDTYGDKKPLSDRFNLTFDGENLLEGAGGPRLKTLAEELQRFEEEEGETNLYQRLDLGRLEAEIEANLDAQVFAIGFGLSRKHTLYLAFPFVRVAVDLDFEVVGENNALDIKTELGELAYESLKDGLDEASQLDRAKIQEVLVDNGYEEAAPWEYQGLGDIRLGLRTGVPTFLSDISGFKKLLVTSELTFPTGYVEDPNILNDVSVGIGHYALANSLKQGYQSTYFHPYISMGYTYSFSTKRTVRLPEGDEFLTNGDRTLKVDYYPGDRYHLGGGFEVPYKYLSFVYNLERKIFFRDVYDGSREGNYQALSKGSSAFQLLHDIGIGLDTTRAYQKNKFPLPLLGSLKYVTPIQQVNRTDLRYIELSLFTFFDARGQ